jgi:hypothetical protein
MVDMKRRRNVKQKENKKIKVINEALGSIDIAPCREICSKTTVLQRTEERYKILDVSYLDRDFLLSARKGEIITRPCVNLTLTVVPKCKYG